MKICIFGAGAVGAYLGGKLSQLQEHDCTLIARGKHLKHMQEHGVTLTIEGKDERHDVQATNDPSEVGPVDLLFITVKSPSLEDALPSIKPLLKDDTIIVPVLNGVPWWYGYKEGGVLDGKPLLSVDPHHTIWETLRPERALGCVTHIASHVEAPGHIVVSKENFFILGEPSNQDSERLNMVVSLMGKAGITTQKSLSIRTEMWMKLLGNLSFNPISVFTRATVGALATNQNIATLISTIMQEMLGLMTKLNINHTVSIEQRISMAKELGSHKTSMLQDAEAGKPLEVEAIVGAALEIAQSIGYATPTISMVYSLLQMHQQVHFSSDQ